MSSARYPFPCAAPPRHTNHLGRDRVEVRHEARAARPWRTVVVGDEVAVRRGRRALHHADGCCHTPTCGTREARVKPGTTERDKGAARAGLSRGCVAPQVPGGPACDRAELRRDRVGERFSISRKPPLWPQLLHARQHALLTQVLDIAHPSQRRQVVIAREHAKSSGGIVSVSALLDSVRHRARVTPRAHRCASTADVRRRGE